MTAGARDLFQHVLLMVVLGMGLFVFRGGLAHRAGALELGACALDLFQLDHGGWTPILLMVVRV